MARTGTLHLWLMRALFAALAGALVFARLLPLDMAPPGLAGPDLFLELAFAWAVRRPEYVPPLLVAGLALAMDLLLQRPPGLWAALTLVGCETLRHRAPALRDLTFLAEWATVAGTLAAMTLAYRLVMTILLVDQAPLGLNLMQLFATLIAYPLVAALSHLVFGVRKRVPGELATGRQTT